MAQDERETRDSGPVKGPGDDGGRRNAWLRLWRRFRPRRRRAPGVELGPCARVRVYADIGGKRKAFVGCVPRPVLEELRRRVKAARGEGRVALVDARPRSAVRVRALVPRAGAGPARRLPAWCVRIGISVRSGERAGAATAQAPERVRVDLQALLREAESVTRSRAAARASEVIETR